jgi:hypothetical protein
MQGIFCVFSAGNENFTTNATKLSSKQRELLKHCSIFSSRVSESINKWPGEEEGRTVLLNCPILRFIINCP